MDLSVICPVYNNVDNMLPMMASFQLQDTSDYEVEYIFVCNGCTDNSEEVIQKMVELFPQTFKNNTILNIDFADTGIARQIGVNNAKGDYILFCDMDDWLLSRTMFKELLDYTKVVPNSVIHFYIDCPEKDWFFIKNGNLMYMTYWRLKHIMTCTVWQYLFPRQIFNKISFKPNKKGEDDLFLTNDMKALAKSGDIGFYDVNKEYYFWDAMNPKSYSYKDITTNCIMLTKEQFIEEVDKADKSKFTRELIEVLENLL